MLNSRGWPWLFPAVWIQIRSEVQLQVLLLRNFNSASLLNLKSCPQLKCKKPGKYETLSWLNEAQCSERVPPEQKNGVFAGPCAALLTGSPGVPAVRSWAHLPGPGIPHISVHGSCGHVESVVAHLLLGKLECLPNFFLSLHLAGFECQLFAAPFPGTGEVLSHLLLPPRSEGDKGHALRELLLQMAPSGKCHRLWFCFLE